MIERVPDYHDSPTFQQLWDALGSKLMEAAQGNLTFNQGVTGSRPVRPRLVFISFCRHFLFVLVPEAGYQGVLRPL